MTMAAFSAGDIRRRLRSAGARRPAKAAYDLALAGVRARFPDASPHEHFLRLALIALGSDLYDGPSPYRQFFRDDISYIGVGVHFWL